MKYFLTLLAALVIIIHSAPIVAEQPTVLIMGEDSDGDSIPRNSQVYGRVINAISGQLQRNGFSVIDETLATVDNYSQGQSRRTDAELMKIAQSIKTPPIDAVITFTVFPTFRADRTTAWMNVLIKSRLINVSTHKILATVDRELPEYVETEPKCDENRQCAFKYVGKYARKLGQDVGSALAIKLRRVTLQDGTAPSSSLKQAALQQAYTLTFENFNIQEFNKIEECLVAFTGYNTHKLLLNTSRNMVVWYKTKSDDVRLKRNLRRMLEYLDVDGQLQCVNKTCKLTKI
ncbi:MAG: hypothetical protein CMM58_02095 [Rhodospirillaceae bacterium]|nr:hypothetical protein [Rhodospirillaceae bacterium]|tara:strand:+ start:342 stop:1208 length:867 start_codon:yes stop_codon:yes gene_type:complete